MWPASSLCSSPAATVGGQTRRDALFTTGRRDVLAFGRCEIRRHSMTQNAGLATPCLPTALSALK
eukprot:11391993-Prorocentrum_lima.AAC.1